MVEGAVVVVKAASGAGAAALRAEGERLRAAAHPGVVALVHSAGTDDAWELRLAHGGRPATLLHPATPAQVASIAAAAADTLADLHERGVVHGRLAARHLLLGPDGQIRLCGFGPGGDATPEDDVAALGAVITELLGGREELEPLPELRWHRRAPWPGVARRALLSLADAATAEPPSRRPSARRLAASIRAAVPDPRPGRRRTGPAADLSPRGPVPSPADAVAPPPPVRIAPPDASDPVAAGPAAQPVPRLGRRPAAPGRHRRTPPPRRSWRAAAAARLEGPHRVDGARSASRHRRAPPHRAPPAAALRSRRPEAAVGPSHHGTPAAAVVGAHVHVTAAPRAGRTRRPSPAVGIEVPGPRKAVL